jgi:hypothetical protein
MGQGTPEGGRLSIVRYCRRCSISTRRGVLCVGRSVNHEDGGRRHFGMRVDVRTRAADQLQRFVEVRRRCGTIRDTRTTCSRRRTA